MAGKTVYIWIAAAVAAAFVVSGCGSALKESGGDQTTPVQVKEQIASVLNCSCHPQFGQWLDSRHANGNASPNRRSCDPCHTGYNLIGDYVEPEPLYFVDCASCHEEDGDFHGGIVMELREDESYRVCTYECHASASHEDHGLDGYRYWENAAGEDAGEDNAPAMTVQTFDGGGTLVVWQLPDEGSWVGTYEGPYHFNGDRTINDTHYNQYWITNEDDKVTIFVPPVGEDSDALHGNLAYVDLAFTAPAAGGVVDSATPNACTASCHSPHRFDLAINHQWFNGAHHPRLEGPVLYYASNYGVDPTIDIETEVTGPTNWHAVEHDDFRDDPTCIRCHSAPGFADQAPDSAITVSYTVGGDYPFGGSFITCNACHDGEGYPSQANKRLRFSGKAWIFGQIDDAVSVHSVISSIEDAGNSAVCVYCHQGRSGCQILIQQTIDSAINKVKNRHDAPSAAILYPSQGIAYEFTDRSYSGNDDHIVLGCVGCHMAEAEPESEAMGGHTFMMADEETGDENSGVCEECHDDASPMEGIDSHSADWDSNAATLTARDEIAYLSSVVLDAILQYPATANTPMVRRSSSGRFSINSGQVCDAPIKIAVFNWYLVYMDKGAWAHNPEYAVQLLRDSLNSMRDAQSEPAYGGTRP